MCNLSDCINEIELGLKLHVAKHKPYEVFGSFLPVCDLKFLMTYKTIKSNTIKILF